VADDSPSHSEFPGDFSWPDESRIRTLLEEILETGSGPEQVSGGDQKLERLLRQRLRRARDVEAQMEAMFPSPQSGDDSTWRSSLEGTQMNGRLPEIPGYEIDSVIGSGGMGVVYRARHLKLDRWVAIKMVLLGAYASRQQMECLLREAQDVAALRHPNIVQVYDVGEHDGFPYFAMELLDGGDLAQILQGNPRPAQEAADLIRVLAGAVHTAHLGGIVHRDLKPGNILLSSDGSPKIGDFSLARRLAHDSVIMTQARQAGTPSYMAPEQAAGDSRAIRPAVDIYSLGAILYELLTGRPPFKAESSTQTRRQVITDEPVPPSQLNSRVPRDLQTICLECLQKDPARRYQTAAELADDLERFTSGNPILARPVGPVERTVKWCRRRPSTTLAIAVSVVAMAGAVAGGVWLQQVEHARDIQEAVRRESARASIEAALPSLSQFVTSRQWVDATGVLRTAQAQVGDAASPELERRLAAAEEQYEVAQELDRIRQSFVALGYSGFVHYPARDAYARMFDRLGIGRDVGVHEAATVVRASPLRDQLLIALDNAAYIEARHGDESEPSRLLAVGRAVTPNLWQDRFRDQDIWADVAGLQRLVEDAKIAEPAPPSHQMILIGLLLDRLGDNAAALEVLREAQLREPSDFSVNFWLARAHENNDAEALQFLRAAAALNPADALTWSEIGLRLLRTGKYEDAVGPLRKATSIQPDFSMTWANLFFSLVGSGRWEEAVAAERDARYAIPTFSLGESEDILQMCRARAAILNKEWSVAAESYARALNGRYMDSAALWYESAAATVLAGDVPAYQRICTSMLELQESAGLREYLVGRACTIGTVSAQDLVRAKELATPELDLQADGHWSLTQRAAFLCRDGRSREAIPILERSLQVSAQPEKLILTWVWLARAHLSLGEHDPAKTWYGKAADWLDQSDTKPEGIHLHDWLEALILRRECEAELAR
jgi:tetratricopeptide (TPR) repeat protein/tRNA A-37 threonylcarbamoyl transferase component Bud32